MQFEIKSLFIHPIQDNPTTGVVFTKRDRTHRDGKLDTLSRVYYYRETIHSRFELCVFIRLKALDTFGNTQTNNFYKMYLVTSIGEMLIVYNIARNASQVT